MDIAAKNAWPCLKPLTGCSNSPGTRITAIAFFRLQSARLGVTAIEHYQNHAVSIASLRLIAIEAVTNPTILHANNWEMLFG